MAGIDLIMMNRQMSDNPLYIYNDNGDRMDISTVPYLDPYDIHDGFDTISRKTKDFNTYSYNGIMVPRVTEIIEYCFGRRDFLFNWAAQLGNSYKQTRQSILDTGNHVHKFISEYLTTGKVPSLSSYKQPTKAIIQRCISNFIDWYDHIKSTGVEIEIIASEVHLICPWVGGTADLITLLNGRKYVMDFKTSKSINIEYIVQASVYMWIINNYYPDYAPIDGIGILRLDKSESKYEDLFLDTINIEDNRMIVDAQKTFGSALSTFYGMCNLNIDLRRVKDEKKKKYD